MNRLVATLLLTSVAATALASPSSPSPKSSGTDAAPRPVARQRLLDQDPRLEKRVTLRQTRRPLSAICAELARQSDVEMRATADVADEPALLVVTEQPMKEVMHQLATLFGYRWTRTSKGSVATYELYQDLRSKQDEEARRNGRHAYALAALRGALREQMRLAQRAPESLLREAAALEQKGRGSYPLREMADPFRRALLQVAATLTPEQWRSLIDGETVHLSTLGEPFAAPLPARIAQALKAAKPAALPPGVQPGFVTAEDESAFRQAEQETQRAWGRARGVCVSARLSLLSGAEQSEAVLNITPTAAMPAGASEEATLLPSAILFGRGPAAPEAREACEAPGDWQSDPKLSRPCRLGVKAAKPPATGETRSFDATLAAIAESAGINLVADAYRLERDELAGVLDGEKLSLYEALDRYVSPRAAWRREGEFFRVRHHGWYHLRQQEIPERLVRQWAASLKKTPRLSLADAATVALSLRDEQLARFTTVMYDAGVQIGLAFGEESAASARQRSLLRAYGSLSPQQRQLIDSGGRLAAAAMPPRARRWLQAAVISGGHQATPKDASGEATAEGLSLGIASRSDEGEITEVVFRYHTEVGSAEAISVSLPRIRAAATEVAMKME